MHMHRVLFSAPGSRNLRSMLNLRSLLGRRLTLAERKLARSPERGPAIGEGAAPLKLRWLCSFAPASVPFPRFPPCPLIPTVSLFHARQGPSDDAAARSERRMVVLIYIQHSPSPNQGLFSISRPLLLGDRNGPRPPIPPAASTAGVIRIRLPFTQPHSPNTHPYAHHPSSLTLLRITSLSVSLFRFWRPL